MAEIQIFYATNRNHLGRRWRPRGYGKKFSDDGAENLRFGHAWVEYDGARAEAFLNESAREDRGDGEGLADYLSECAREARLIAYRERLDPNRSELAQPNAKLGSRALFADLTEAMRRRSDVLVYIHGYNVAWHEALGTAAALQLMLNRPGAGDPGQSVLVVLFSWPSDGLALPFVSYKSDRSEAKASGYAVGRGFLKLRDYLAGLRDRSGGQEPCGQSLHLLCHSMGNYVLQNALARMITYTPYGVLPRLFEHIFMCAPDVNDDVLEPGRPMERLHQLCRRVSVYHNRGDVAMYVSDYTKGNPDRLGTAGAARPAQVHNKVHQVDCTPLVAGLVEHSYYLWGPVNTDIRQSIDGIPFDDPKRRRRRESELPNVWTLY